ncbi:MAG: TIGR02206 family membrane protein [Verrucomicrobiota bacterium]
MSIDEIEFPVWRMFRPEHCATLILTTLIIVLMARLARRSPDSVAVNRQTRILAVILLLTYPVKLLGFWLAGYHTMYYWPWPMHLCDWAAYVCAIALLTRKRWLAEIGYFWGVGATMQGLITPDLQFGFPHPVWFTFTHLHSGVVIAAFYLVCGLQLQPRRFGFVRAWAALHVYLLVAYIVNTISGHNYGFLRAKPMAGSLMDILPPEPWHILALEPVTIFVFLLCQIPFWFLGKKPEQSETLSVATK